MPRPRSQELKDRAKKIRKLLRRKKLHDTEIAPMLGITVNDVAYCRREFKIKAGGSPVLFRL